MFALPPPSPHHYHHYRHHTVSVRVVYAERCDAIKQGKGVRLLDFSGCFSLVVFWYGCLTLYTYMVCVTLTYFKRIPVVILGAVRAFCDCIGNGL